MTKKKSKKDKKREQRDQLAAEEEAAQTAFEQRRRLYRMAAVAVPIVAGVGALAIYLGLDDRQLAALTAMVGLAIWVPVLLGALGSRIEPRDRTRAGSIDFGSKRR